MQNDMVLAKLDTARTALAEAKTIQETKHILDIAAAAEIYAKRQRLGEDAIRYATEIKMEALRQLGNMLKETPRNPGVRTAGKVMGSPIVVPPIDIPTLAEMGLDKKTSKLAQDVASLPPEEFVKVAAGVATLTQVQAEINAVKNREARMEKLSAIAQGNKPLGTAPERFPIVLADPPWLYDFQESHSREIENHYPTMPVEDICNLPVFDIVTSDAVLFLWATSPKLPQAMMVVEAWRFTYKTSFVWVKDKIANGYWCRGQHELLLVATKGTPPTPLPADRHSSVINAPRGEHSVKPVEVYEIIEAMFPTLPKIELFCRLPRKGWSVWGNEV